MVVLRNDGLLIHSLIFCAESDSLIELNQLLNHRSLLKKKTPKPSPQATIFV